MALAIAVHPLFSSILVHFVNNLRSVIAAHKTVCFNYHNVIYHASVICTGNCVPVLSGTFSLRQADEGNCIFI